jgi:hypothetical protein
MTIFLILDLNPDNARIIVNALFGLKEKGE